MLYVVEVTYVFIGCLTSGGWCLGNNNVMHLRDWYKIMVGVSWNVPCQWENFHSSLLNVQKMFAVPLKCVKIFCIPPITWSCHNIDMQVEYPKTFSLTLVNLQIFFSPSGFSKIFHAPLILTYPFTHGHSYWQLPKGETLSGRGTTPLEGPLSQ